MNRFLFGAVIAFVFPLFVSGGYGQNQASATPPANDAIVHHMEELEEQVKALRAEVAALKETDKTTMTTGSASRCYAAKQSCQQRNGCLYTCRAITGRTSGVDFVEWLRRSLLRAELQQSGLSDERSALLRSQ